MEIHLVSHWDHAEVMIETSHPLHTHIRSTSSIYKVFLYLLLWVWFIIIRRNLNLILLGLTVTVWSQAQVTEVLLVSVVSHYHFSNAVIAMIAASNPLHTHIKSNYKVLHHILQCLLVIGCDPNLIYA